MAPTHQALHPGTPVTQGRLIQQQDGTVVLGLPGTDYQLHLQAPTPIHAKPHGRVSGVITARAKRVDVVGTGGRYIEPVYGRPRRLQGTITATDLTLNTLTVDCACPVVCKLTMGQDASQFSVGQLVSFDVERGATLTPINSEPLSGHHPG